VASEQEIADAFDTRVLMATDESGAVWCGTQWWMVRKDDVIRPTAAAMTKKINSMETTHELRWAQGVGGGKIMRPPNDPTSITRVYERPDGAAVLINEAFIKTIEAMGLTTTPELDEDGDYGPCVVPYRLAQGDDPLGPVAVITNPENEQVIGIIMPIRPAAVS
jgi:hypothetical protein